MIFPWLEFVVFAVCMASLGAVGAMAIARYRRRRRVLRWARVAGIDPHPYEPTDELLARIGARWSVRGPWR